jgi:hypothetical protein
MGDTQAGFRKGKSCADNIHVMQQIAERSIEFDRNVYCVFIYFSSAFDTIDRVRLCEVLNKFLDNGLFQRFSLIQAGSVGKVKMNGNISEKIQIGRGVRQGCPLAPILFIAALAEATKLI